MTFYYAHRRRSTSARHLKLVPGLTLDLQQGPGAQDWLVITPSSHRIPGESMLANSPWYNTSLVPVGNIHAHGSSASVRLVIMQAPPPSFLRLLCGCVRGTTNLCEVAYTRPRPVMVEGLFFQSSLPSIRRRHEVEWKKAAEVESKLELRYVPVMTGTWL